MMAAFNTNMGYFGPTNTTLNLPAAPTTDFSNPAASYQSAYAAARNINQQLHERVQGGYAQMLQQAQAANQGVQAGYRQLQRGVMRRLAGTNRANIQDIADQYAARGGAMDQQLIDRGLGNTTVQQSVSRGLLQDRSKEVTRSQGAFAQMMAQYQSQLGQSRLSAMERGNNFLTGIQGRGIDSLERTSAPYPDIGIWAQLARAGGMGGGGVSGAGLPGMPGPHPGYRPVGGYAPMDSSEGSYNVDPGPMTGASIYDQYAGMGGYAQAAAGAPGIVSGYGRTPAGVMFPSYAASGQYGGDYSGAYAPGGGDYSAGYFSGQGEATGYGTYKGSAF